VDRQDLGRRRAEVVGPAGRWLPPSVKSVVCNGSGVPIDGALWDILGFISSSCRGSSRISREYPSVLGRRGRSEPGGERVREPRVGQVSLSPQHHISAPSNHRSFRETDP
jgi:hypothetical protein